MNREALDKLTDGPNMLIWVADELNLLAGAFYDTGNEKVADKLGSIADRVKQARKMIEAGRGEALSDAVRVSEEATGNMLRAVMAGVMLPKGEPDSPAVRTLGEK